MATVGTNTDQGKAYVFRHNGTSCVQEAILTASDGATKDYFGTSVSINGAGDVLVVGAHWANIDINVEQGKVYVFEVFS